MEDVELHSESCDFLLCCLRQPSPAMRCWELMCVCTVSLSHCLLSLLLAYACLHHLHLHIGTSESRNVDPER